MYRWTRASVLMLTLVASGSCGILDDATAITFDTGWQAFELDTAQIGLTAPGASIPSVTCTAANDICAQAGAQFSCGGANYACAVKCGAKGSCEAQASAEIAIPVDISAQVKNKTSAKLLSKVTVDSIAYNTDENTLNFDTPTVSIYVGPGAASKTSDAGVVLFTKLDPIKAGEKPNKALRVEAAGQAALAELIKDYTKPFKVFVKASMTFGSGQAVPAGLFKGKAKVYIKANPL